MQWQPLSNIEILKRLEIPAADSGKVLDMVLDTDTYNEVDDQFALCYALCSACSAAYITLAVKTRSACMKRRSILPRHSESGSI